MTTIITPGRRGLACALTLLLAGCGHGPGTAPRTAPAATFTDIVREQGGYVYPAFQRWRIVASRVVPPASVPADLGGIPAILRGRFVYFDEGYLTFPSLNSDGDAIVPAPDPHQATRPIGRREEIDERKQRELLRVGEEQPPKSAQSLTGLAIGADLGQRGNHHDPRARCSSAEQWQGFQPAHARHFQIEQDHVGRALAQDRQRLFRAGSNGHQLKIGLALHDPRKGRTDNRRIVDHQNPDRRERPARRAARYLQGIGMAHRMELRPRPPVAA